MSDCIRIEWTDATWNPVRGCTKISPGCKHCYAATFAERWRGIPGHPYEHGFDLRLVADKLVDPILWAQSRTVFVNSMSDLFHVGVPETLVKNVFGGALAAHGQSTILLLQAGRRPLGTIPTSEAGRAPPAPGETSTLEES